MASRDNWSAFLQAVEPPIRSLKEPAEIVLAIEPQLRQLVLSHDWLDEKYRRAIPSKPYAQYLLYRPEDYAFSVVSFVWNPGQGSPIHDHCTWGVIGQYQGQEEESRFRASASGRLELIATVPARPGDVGHVYPPHRDIHQILNHTPDPTISIHIYGGDIGSQARYAYDLETGVRRPFVSGYDAVV